jgi:hypothetical protein
MGFHPILLLLWLLSPDFPTKDLFQDKHSIKQRMMKESFWLGFRAHAEGHVQKEW